MPVNVERALRCQVRPIEGPRYRNFELLRREIRTEACGQLREIDCIARVEEPRRNRALVRIRRSQKQSLPDRLRLPWQERDAPLEIGVPGVASAPNDAQSRNGEAPARDDTSCRAERGCRAVRIGVEENV